MVRYIAIEQQGHGDAEIYGVDTEAEIQAAREALRDAGLRGAAVWSAPVEPVDALRHEGSPDAVETTQWIFAA